MPAPPLTLTTSIANLRWLATIRLFIILGLILTLGYTHLTSRSQLVHPAHWSILGLFLSLNLFTYWRVHQAWPVTDTEYFIQLLVDISGLTVLLYVSGGATNPFVSYYLVPITISAAILRWHFTWVIAGLSLLAYTLLLFFYQPLPLVDLQPDSGHAHHGDSPFNLHILGMWFTFALSTGLITYFVVKMAHALRKQESDQVANREHELLDEQILAVATLAAGTAHELGTPLATMTLLLDEMAADHPQPASLQEDMAMLKNQLTNCRHILQNLVSTAEASSQGQKTAVQVSHYLQQIISRWQVLRPETRYQLTLDEQCESTQLEIDSTLEQAILNLLNNAADACQDPVEISCRCDNANTIISIRDHGPGIPLQIAEQIGKPFVTTKNKGLGLGLFLTHATINRFGGNITLYNHPDGGSLAELKLPINTSARTTEMTND